jgi:hypothetical protein
MKNNLSVYFNDELYSDLSDARTIEEDRGLDIL